MRRRHVFEFGDQSWLSGLLREAYMDCLNTAIKLGGHYRHMYRPFRDWAARSDCDEILDMGSGGGGPIDTLLEGAARARASMPRIIVSDLFPSLPHFHRLERKYGHEAVGMVSHPVSAECVNMPGLRLRSVCTAFHHLRPEQAHAVVADAAVNSDGLFVMESFHRDIAHFLMVLLSGPFVYMLAPFRSGRFSWAKFMVCTLCPIVPLMVMFDGCISVLRTYTPEEIRAMFPEALRSDFCFEAGTHRYMGMFKAFYFAANRRQTVAGANGRNPIRRSLAYGSRQSGIVNGGADR